MGGFYGEGGQTLQQVARGGCGVSILRDVLEQPAPAAPSPAEAGLDSLQRRHLQPQPLCKNTSRELNGMASPPRIFILVV